MNKFQQIRIARLKTKFINLNLLENVNKYFQDSTHKYLIKTQSRSSTILPCFVNLDIYVYNGKHYIPIHVIPDYLGHKFGEFIYTRRFVAHKKDGKKLMFKKKVIKINKPFNYFYNFSTNTNIFFKKRIFNKLTKKNEKTN